MNNSQKAEQRRNVSTIIFTGRKDDDGNWALTIVHPQKYLIL